MIGTGKLRFSQLLIVVTALCAVSCACSGEKKADISGTAAKGNTDASADTLTGQGCIRTGCSGHICANASDGALVSTCEWREEYACYKTARCEKQGNGQCGWTPSESLSSCLKAAGAR